MPSRLWLKLTTNWFVLGLHCALTGHQWRTYRIFNTRVTNCGRCGKVRGYQSVDIVVVGPDQEVRRIRRHKPTGERLLAALEAEAARLEQPGGQFEWQVAHVLRRIIAEVKR